MFDENVHALGGEHAPSEDRGDGLQHVHGDLAHLAGLTALEDLRLDGTAVRGDFAHLAGLTALTMASSSDARHAARELTRQTDSELLDEVHGSLCVFLWGSTLVVLYV